MNIHCAPGTEAVSVAIQRRMSRYPLSSGGGRYTHTETSLTFLKTSIHRVYILKESLSVFWTILFSYILNPSFLGIVHT